MSREMKSSHENSRDLLDPVEAFKKTLTDPVKALRDFREMLVLLAEEQ